MRLSRVISRVPQEIFAARGDTTADRSGKKKGLGEYLSSSADLQFRGGRSCSPSPQGDPAPVFRQFVPQASPLR